MGDFNAVINIPCKHTKNQSDYTTTQIKQAKFEVTGVRIPGVKFRAGSNELNEEDGKLAEVEPVSDEGESEEQAPNNEPKGLGAQISVHNHSRSWSTSRCTLHKYKGS